MPAEFEVASLKPSPPATGKEGPRERPLNAYTLIAVKPKLKKSEPDARTKWQDGALSESKGAKNVNASLGRLVTCQNVTSGRRKFW